jgi:hypothetical protein
MRECIDCRYFTASLFAMFASVAYAGRYDDDFAATGGSGISGIAVFIGLIHGLPIVLLGHWLRSKGMVILATVAMIVLAFAFGNIHYVAYDLFFIGIGTWIAFQFEPVTIASKHFVHSPPVNQIASQKSPSQEKKLLSSIEVRRAALIQDAENGDANAQLFLFMLLTDNGNVVSANSGKWIDLSFPQNVQQGFYWLNKAIDQRQVSTVIFVPDFLEQCLREETIDSQYLDLIIKVANRVVQEGGNEEDVNFYNGLREAQKLLFDCENVLALELINGLYEVFEQKYVKVNRMETE